MKITPADCNHALTSIPGLTLRKLWATQLWWMSCREATLCRLHSFTIRMFQFSSKSWYLEEYDEKKTEIWPHNLVVQDMNIYPDDISTQRGFFFIMSTFGLTTAVTRQRLQVFYDVTLRCWVSVSILQTTLSSSSKASQSNNNSCPSSTNWSLKMKTLNPLKDGKH